LDIYGLPHQPVSISLSTDDIKTTLHSVTPLTPSSTALPSADASQDMLFTPSPVVTAPTHPLLAEVQLAKQRYDHFQKAFRDCKIALKELKKSIGELPPVGEMSTVIQTAVDRLNDFNEDARVELEIRVADEERIISGYETLLSVPGAMSDEIDEGELRQEVESFAGGSSASVMKAVQQFSRKLDDLQHDIACIKRTIYEMSSGEISPAPLTPTKNTQGWSSWTGGILGGSRPVSPAPTFGSVMTTPRVRQSSFGSFIHRPSLPNLRAASSSSSSLNEQENAFASLGLRIPMPALHLSQSPLQGLFLSPGMSHGSARPQKPRASSTPMYMLGLGMRSTSHGFPTSTAKSPSSKLSRYPEENEAEPENGAMDTDVE